MALFWPLGRKKKKIFDSKGADMEKLIDIFWKVVLKPMLDAVMWLVRKVENGGVK